MVFDQETFSSKAVAFHDRQRQSLTNSILQQEHNQKVESIKKEIVVKQQDNFRKLLAKKAEQHQRNQSMKSSLHSRLKSLTKSSASKASKSAISPKTQT